MTAVVAERRGSPSAARSARQEGLPVVIQGGMGVGVSGWRLASAVARAGQLGVVSGVALDAMLARRLQLGDPGGHLRRALAAFPVRDVADRIVRQYYVDGGIGPGMPFRPVPRLALRAHRARTELIAAANFAEVFLAKEGHDGAVGINYLEKIQMATPPAVYGAMLAGVDYVLMGAGIPVGIPALLRDLAAHEPARLPVTVAGAPAGGDYVAFEPFVLTGGAMPPLRTPRFLAIISSAVLAGYLARSDASRPDGFVVEGPVAGGHSAPPRGRLTVDENGEPVYGPRDAIDLAKVAATGLPFWLAGGYSTPDRVRAARAAGAAGVQVGSPFALCQESGIEPGLRERIVAAASAGELRVRGSAIASPAGFPFKVAHVPGTLSDGDVYAARERICDLGYLRVPFARPDGGIGYRCPAEPVAEFARKGGDVAEAQGRRCLCNGLLATIGLGQRRDAGRTEPPLVTLGQDLGFLPDLIARHGAQYHAADVVGYLLGR